MTTMTTMTATHTFSEELVHGEVQCLNCGRTLARATRRLADGKTTIRPARGESEILLARATGRGLRCRRCGGRAFLEFDVVGAPAA